jgi:Ca2+-binding RTX toxin-like protein
MTSGTEKLDITSFSGNDSLSTGAGVTLAMTVDAGPGDDTIGTGDGDDLIKGDDGNDTLNGGGGSDRIVGERGSDTMNGGAGDDTLVWNNGDGSDVMNGDDGTDRIEDNLGAADDISSLKPENGRVRYDRTNAPFSLSVGSSEVFELNMLGGNDSLVTAPGLGIAVVADGGAGDDTLSLRNGGADVVLGGPGADKATVDAIDAVAADVESVDRPVAGAVALAKTAKVRRGVASLKLSCPAGTTGCSGQLVLLTAKAVKLGKVKAQLSLGRASFNLAAGEAKTVKVKLARGAARLATKKSLAASALVSGAGTGVRVTLKF